jgi:hypothetical protein
MIPTEKSYLRFTAISAFAAVITTVLNTQLPRFYVPPNSFDEGAALIHDENKMGHGVQERF